MTTSEEWAYKTFSLSTSATNIKQKALKHKTKMTQSNTSNIFQEPHKSQTSRKNLLSQKINIFFDVNLILYTFRTVLNVTSEVSHIALTIKYVIFINARSTVSHIQNEYDIKVKKSTKTLEGLPRGRALSRQLIWRGGRAVIARQICCRDAFYDFILSM